MGQVGYDSGDGKKLIEHSDFLMPLVLRYRKQASQKYASPLEDVI